MACVTSSMAVVASSNTIYEVRMEASEWTSSCCLCAIRVSRDVILLANSTVNSSNFVCFTNKLLTVCETLRSDVKWKMAFMPSKKDVMAPGTSRLMSIDLVNLALDF